jgi:hypothetical protein
MTPNQLSHKDRSHRSSCRHPRRSAKTGLFRSDSSSQGGGQFFLENQEPTMMIPRANYADAATLVRAKTVLRAIVAATMLCVLVEPLHAANLIEPFESPSPTLPASKKISKHPSDRPTVNAIVFKGPITEGDALELQIYVSSLPNKPRTVIYLDSPGGDVYEGLRLGRFFFEARIETAVDANSMCASACAYAFMGGHDSAGNPHRVKYSTGTLGFHSPHCSCADVVQISANDARQVERLTQRTVFAIAVYLQAIGADLNVLFAILQAGPDQMNFVSNKNANTLGIMVWDEALGRIINPKLVLDR